MLTSLSNSALRAVLDCLNTRVPHDPQPLSPAEKPDLSAYAESIQPHAALLHVCLQLQNTLIDGALSSDKQAFFTAMKHALSSMPEGDLILREVSEACEYSDDADFSPFGRHELPNLPLSEKEREVVLEGILYGLFAVFKRSASTEATASCLTQCEKHLFGVVRTKCIVREAPLTEVCDLVQCVETNDATALFARWSRFHDCAVHVEETLKLEHEFTDFEHVFAERAGTTPSSHIAYQKGCEFLFAVSELASDSPAKPTGETFEALLEELEEVHGEGFNPSRMKNTLRSLCGKAEYETTLWTDTAHRANVKKALFKELDRWAITRGMSKEAVNEMARFLSPADFEGVHRHDSLQLFYRAVNFTTLAVKCHFVVNPETPLESLPRVTSLEGAHQKEIATAYTGLASMQKIIEALTEDDIDVAYPITYMDMEGAISQVESVCPGFRGVFLDALSEDTVCPESHRALLPLRLADPVLYSALKKSLNTALLHHVLHRFFAVSSDGLAAVTTAWNRSGKEHRTLRPLIDADPLWGQKNLLSQNMHRLFTLLLAKNALTYSPVLLLHDVEREEITAPHPVADDRADASSVASECASIDEELSEVDLLVEIQSTEKEKSARLHAAVELLRSYPAHAQDVVRFLRDTYAESELGTVFEAVYNANGKNDEGDIHFGKNNVGRFILNAEVVAAVAALRT